MHFFIPLNRIWQRFGRLSAHRTSTVLARLRLAMFVRIDARTPPLLSIIWSQLSVTAYGVGAGAVDPAGTGDGASVEPCVFGGFLFADLFDAGVGDGLLIAAVLVLVPVFPDCSQDARNAMPIRTAISANIYFFIAYNYFAPGRVVGCLRPNEPFEMRGSRLHDNRIT
jgi:hypothetical protein